MEQAGRSERYVVKLSVFVPRTLSQWIGDEAAKAGVPKSTFVRMIIFAFKAETNHTEQS